MSKTRHGKRGTSIYRIWAGILQRCNNRNNPDYLSYGGRGIKVDISWLTFDGFLKDMGPTHIDGLTIERVDVNGHYTKTNCIWIPRNKQNRNKRTSVFIDTPWGRMTKVEACEKSGIHKATLDKRLKNGWPINLLFIEPNPSNKIKYKL